MTRTETLVMLQMSGKREVYLKDFISYDEPNRVLYNFEELVAIGILRPNDDHYILPRPVGKPYKMTDQRFVEKHVPDARMTSFTNHGLLYFELWSDEMGFTLGVAKRTPEMAFGAAKRWILRMCKDEVRNRA